MFVIAKRLYDLINRLSLNCLQPQYSGVEQSGSSPGSYPGGRRFKSCSRNKLIEVLMKTSNKSDIDFGLLFLVLAIVLIILYGFIELLKTN